MVIKLNTVAHFLKEHLQFKNIPEEVQEKISDQSNRFGKYIKISRLGKGGSGTVWKAYDTTLNRYICLKFLNADSEPIFERFIKEANTIAGLDHPNIVPIFEFGNLDDNAYIAMKFIEGMPLSSKIGHLSTKQSLEIISKVCDALVYAHKKGVIHRDIKPHNILMNQDGTVFLVDFGIAKNLSSATVTTEGTIVGTPQYMSPEQAEGKTVDKRTDVYSVGATLFHCITNSMPFNGETTLEVFKKVANEEVPNPLTLNNTLPEEIGIIITKAMCKDPAYRYQSIEQLKTDIELFLNGEPIKGRKISLKYYFSKKIKKHKTIVFASALVLLITSVIFLYYYSNYKRKTMAETFYLQAVAHINKGDIKSARLFLERSLEYNPKFTYALNKLASIHWEREEDLDEAKTLYNKTLQIDPNNIEAYLGLGRIYLRQGLTEKTLFYCDKVIGLDQNNPDVYSILGAVKLMNKEYEKTIEYLNKSIRLKPQNEAVLSNLGYTYEKLGMYEKAINHLEEAIKLQPLYFIAYFYLASVYEKTGQFGKAIESYAKVITISPNHAESYLNIGTIHANANRLKESIYFFEQASQKNPKLFMAFYRLGRVHLLMEQYNKAINPLERALSLNPDHDDAWVSLGECQIQLDKFKRAEESLKKALDINPRNEAGIYDLGIIYTATKQKEPAFAIYERLKALDTERSNTFANQLKEQMDNTFGKTY
ncbi:MAG: tetratricopeptide repeat protein [Planctomycetes bacterium]|nr:tetratricopeptide repeat protein [Planctomycetota bacterium]